MAHPVIPEAPKTRAWMPSAGVVILKTEFQTWFGIEEREDLEEAISNCWMNRSHCDLSHQVVL